MTALAVCPDAHGVDLISDGSAPHVDATGNGFRPTPSTHGPDADLAAEGDVNEALLDARTGHTASNAPLDDDPVSDELIPTTASTDAPPRSPHSSSNVSATGRFASATGGESFDEGLLCAEDDAGHSGGREGNGEAHPQLRGRLKTSRRGSGASITSATNGPKGLPLAPKGSGRDVLADKPRELAPKGQYNRPQDALRVKKRRLTTAQKKAEMKAMLFLDDTVAIDAASKKYKLPTIELLNTEPSKPSARRPSGGVGECPRCGTAPGRFSRGLSDHPPNVTLDPAHEYFKTAGDVHAAVQQAACIARLAGGPEKSESTRAGLQRLRDAAIARLTDVSRARRQRFAAMANELAYIFACHVVSAQRGGSIALAGSVAEFLSLWARHIGLFAARFFEREWAEGDPVLTGIFAAEIEEFDRASGKQRAPTQPTMVNASNPLDGVERSPQRVATQRRVSAPSYANFRPSSTNRVGTAGGRNGTAGGRAGSAGSTASSRPPSVGGSARVLGGGAATTGGCGSGATGDPTWTDDCAAHIFIDQGVGQMIRSGLAGLALNECTFRAAALRLAVAADVAERCWRAQNTPADFGLADHGCTMDAMRARPVDGEPPVGPRFPNQPESLTAFFARNASCSSLAGRVGAWSLLTVLSSRGARPPAADGDPLPPTFEEVQREIAEAKGQQRRDDELLLGMPDGDGDTKSPTEADPEEIERKRGPALRPRPMGGVPLPFPALERTAFLTFGPLATLRRRTERRGKVGTKGKVLHGEDLGKGCFPGCAVQ